MEAIYLKKFGETSENAVYVFDGEIDNVSKLNYCKYWNPYRFMILESPDPCRVCADAVKKQKPCSGKCNLLLGCICHEFECSSGHKPGED
jgi:hypothetical protein